MTNADKFKSLFGLYATELWAMPEKDFLKWLNSEAMNCSEFPNNSDTISRQAAIDALKTDMASLDHIIQGMSGYDVRLDAYVSQRNQVNCDIDTISNLPPVQPEPCEDAVSRKAVKDGFVEMCSLICPYTEKQRHIMCGSCLLGTAFDVLEATQPVTPKQRTEALKAEIRRMKRSFTTCINSDYYTGYMSALSAVEGYIAKMEGDAE